MDPGQFILCHQRYLASSATVISIQEIIGTTSPVLLRLYVVFKTSTCPTAGKGCACVGAGVRVDIISFTTTPCTSPGCNIRILWKKKTALWLCSAGILKADLDGTTFAYDCRMQFLERALLVTCKTSHTILVTQHCLYLQ